MPLANAPTPLHRLRLRVTGVVQGVGFRPFVYGLALKFGLAGLVGNDSAGVFIEVEGAPDVLAAFQAALTHAAPPLSRIDSLTAASVPVRGDRAFVIVESRVISDAVTLISPDLCVCDDCLREMLDPADRRYRYPFINCTNCGPRFTIIADIPYDRPNTTMAGFPMCEACAAEYQDPLNRRFHAQPIACPRCGPQLMFLPHRADVDPVAAACEALTVGNIVAVKGLGGFHLACDATNPAAVARLRARKQREEKPFAVMVHTMDAAHLLAHIDAAEAALLVSRERPIVLLAKRAGSPLAGNVAPGNPAVGLMLPYTPLHDLLLAAFGRPLVMTSGNLSGEPIVKDDDEAQVRLAALADAFLLHDRPIHVSCDDSVVHVMDGMPLPVRRSRGAAPLPVTLPFAVPSLLAAGGELKNTLCLTRDNLAFMSQHIGDMEHLETRAAFHRAYDHLRALLRVTPQAIACDPHPGYGASHLAREIAAAHALPLVTVQHHHAHIAAVMAEHGVTEPVIGFAFDGTGYGTDGAIWGGEVLIADYGGFRRAAHLRYVPLPGGDAAVQRPYRVALAHLWAAGIPWDEDLAPVAVCPPSEQRVLLRQLETGLNCVPTSSMGRLFDAAAALAGVRQTVRYEAQAAIEFEGLALPSQARYAFTVTGDEIDPAPVWRAMIADLRAGVCIGEMSTRFHNAVADAVLALASQHERQIVALSGGVFQNITLLRVCRSLLEAHGFRVLMHHIVPPNDGGLALGQAAIAGHQLLQLQIKR